MGADADATARLRRTVYLEPATPATVAAVGALVGGPVVATPAVDSTPARYACLELPSAAAVDEVVAKWPWGVLQATTAVAASDLPTAAAEVNARLQQNSPEGQPRALRHAEWRARCAAYAALRRRVAVLVNGPRVPPEGAARRRSAVLVIRVREALAEEGAPLVPLADTSPAATGTAAPLGEAAPTADAPDGDVAMAAADGGDPSGGGPPVHDADAAPTGGGEPPNAPPDTLPSDGGAAADVVMLEVPAGVSTPTAAVSAAPGPGSPDVLTRVAACLRDLPECRVTRADALEVRAVFPTRRLRAAGATAALANAAGVGGTLALAREGHTASSTKRVIDDSRGGDAKRRKVAAAAREKAARDAAAREQLEEQWYAGGAGWRDRRRGRGPRQQNPSTADAQLAEQLGL